MFHTIGEIKTGNARFSSIYTALIKTSSVSRIAYSKPQDLIRSWNFFAICLSPFTYTSSFYLAETKP